VPDPKTLGGFFAVMAFTVVANLMLKLGAGDPEAHRMSGLLGWKSAAGLALFGCGGIVYAFLLRRVPLNIAQIFTSAQFVGVVVAASLVLGEPISAAPWLGIPASASGSPLSA
jgi:drug/metabolite transporter (DMT)-like permease